MKIKKLVKEYLVIGAVYCIVRCYKHGYDVIMYGKSKGLNEDDIISLQRECYRHSNAEVKKIPLNEKIGNAIINIINWPSLVVHTIDDFNAEICKRIDEKVKTSSSLQ